MLLGLLAVPSALAADSVYWGNSSTTTLSFARLDGSGGGELDTTGATVGGPQGTAIDLAAGKIYWADPSTHTISFANLDGSGGGGQLTTPGVTVNQPIGLAIDPAAGMIYWADPNPPGTPTIAFAKLDGSGGDELDTTGATLDSPEGVAIDPAAGLIYWSNEGNGTISYAKLDDSGGGGQLPTAPATLTHPDGVAVDTAAGILYVVDGSTSTISFARLDGSGGGPVSINGATANGPEGLALDPSAGKLYWANSNVDTISFANLDNSGGGDQLSTTGATPDGPAFPVLLKVPSGAELPVISGTAALGSALSCSQGSWAPDLLGSFLYRAPQVFAYQWSLDGADIAGATSSSITASSGGAYRCRVTASNFAGATSQTSSPFTLQSAAVPSNSFSEGKPKLNKKNGTASLPVTVPGPGTLTLNGRGLVPQRGARPSGALAKTVGGAGTVKLLVKAKGRARKKLNESGKAKVKPTVTFTPSGGGAASKTKSITLKKTIHR